MIKKITIFLAAILVFSAISGIVFAQAEPFIEPAPKILPGNPLYFLKELGRGLEKWFTIGTIAKTKLELRFADEKAKEIYVSVKNNKTKSLERAIKNYNENTLRIKNRLIALKENSNNPNIQDLLEILTLRAIEHEELFDKLDLKEEFKNVLKEAKNNLSGALLEVFKKNSGEFFKTGLDTAIKKIKDGSLKEFRAILIMDRLEEQDKNGFKDKIAELKNDLILKFEGRFKGELLNLEEEFKKINLSEPENLRVLDEIREGIKDQSLKSSLNSIRAGALGSSGEGKTEDDAKRILDLAKTSVEDLKLKIAGTANVPQSIKEILERADFNLEQAQKFYSDGKFGAAFGQATAALAAAKNGLNQIATGNDNLEEKLKPLRIDFDDLLEKAKNNNLTKDNNAKLYDLFNQAEKALIESKKLETLNSIKVVLAEIDTIIKNALLTASSTETKEMSRPAEWTVEVTDQGFSPREIKIKKRDKIIWINKTSRSVWPASNPHPVHTGYPGRGGCISSDFDACRGLTTNESWFFVFNTVGIWFYHDHFSPGATGIIEVIE